MGEGNNSGHSFKAQVTTRQIHHEEIKEDFTPMNVEEGSSSRPSRAYTRRLANILGH